MRELRRTWLCGLLLFGKILEIGRLRQRRALCSTATRPHTQSASRCTCVSIMSRKKWMRIPDNKKLLNFRYSGVVQTRYYDSAFLGIGLILLALAWEWTFDTPFSSQGVESGDLCWATVTDSYYLRTFCDALLSVQAPGSKLSDIG